MTPAFNSRVRVDSVRNGGRNITAAVNTTKRASPLSPAEMSAMMNHTLNNITAAIAPPSLDDE